MVFTALVLLLVFIILMLYPWPVGLQFAYDLAGDGAIDLSFPRFMPFKFSRVFGSAAHAAKKGDGGDVSLPVHLLHTIVQFDAFQWVTDVGTGDAGATAIMSGVAWSVKGAVVNVLQRHFDFRRPPVVSVRPCWDDAHLATSVDCIIRVRPGHVIVVQATYWWATMVKGVGRVGTGQRSSH